MTDHNPLPRCPYCGEPMDLEDNSESVYWYECYKCGATTPTEEAEQAAYEAAMNRWQEPNRVLTMEEATEQRAVWVESDYCGIAPAIVFDSVSKHYSIIVAAFNDHDNNKVWFEKTQYGKHWRCWLRKPTAEEMESTPWESKKENEK